jgi:poly(3-hydroxybutyrate) depolymerase
VRILKLVAALLAAVAGALAAAYLWHAPEGPPAGSESARRLRLGPHAVASAERSFVDATRATPAHGGFAGAPERRLEATLWFPAEDPTPHPLVVYSHGFMSMRSEAVRHAEHLASHGMVVVAVDYPATNFRAPGGPNALDVASQPVDVSFLIDAITGWSEAERPFRGGIDPARIGVAGLSLGGLTSTLAAFHPVLRDPRLSAAVSIAGPSAIFSSAFFAHARLPFLMIAGDADAMVDFAANAAPLPGKLQHGGALLAIGGGSHTGFSPMADGLMRAFGSPDRIGCFALTRTLEVDAMRERYAALGRPEQGVVIPNEVVMPCAHGVPPRALAAGRQLAITTLALHAFLESHWAKNTETRADAARFLAEGLGRDFPEAALTPIAPAGLGRVERPEAPRVPEIHLEAERPSL